MIPGGIGITDQRTDALPHRSRRVGHHPHNRCTRAQHSLKLGKLDTGGNRDEERLAVSQKTQAGQCGLHDLRFYRDQNHSRSRRQTYIELYA